MRKFFQKFIILVKLRNNLREAIGMQWWKKASNECRRIERVEKIGL